MVQRKRAANLVLLGAINGLLAFVFAFAIGVTSLHYDGSHDLNGEPFASGRSYFPPTVSEMVSDIRKPQGKAFWAFAFIAALLIFFSWYTTNLRNVYIGDDPQICGIAWISLRQYVPPLGMMLLSSVTTVPAAKASVTDQFCIYLHTTGAAMFFVGYMVCEAHAIGLGPFSGWIDKLRESRSGIRQRKFTIAGGAFFCMIFFVFQIALSLPLYDPGDLDEWGPLEGHQGVQLLDTAGGQVQAVKVCSYVSEVITGLFIISNLLVVWYHCEERHYDLPEELHQVRATAMFCERTRSGDDAADVS